MITAPGRRTGIPRSTCVRYLETAHGLVVCGTGSGSRQDPDLFRNRRTADQIDVQVKAKRLRARPREAVRPERDDLWNNLILVQTPRWIQTQRWNSTPDKRGRTIPVVVLEPHFHWRGTCADPPHPYALDG